MPLWKSVIKEGGEQPEARLKYEMRNSLLWILFCVGGLGSQTLVSWKITLSRFCGLLLRGILTCTKCIEDN